MVANAGKVFDPATAHQYDAMFLKIMAFAGDICDDFLAIGQTNPSYLPECGVWLFRGLGLNLEANASALWTLM